MKREWWQIAGSALLGILLALLLLMLDGCAPYPSVKYDEMDDAVINAETKEEVEYYKKYRDRFEADGIKAAAWFGRREACLKNDGGVFGVDVIWACTGTPPNWDRRPPEGLDAFVKTYRRWRHICGCYNRDKFFRSLGMGR